MAKIINIDENRNELKSSLQKAIQSTNLNFIIGSGCTYPAIKTLGSIEKDIQMELEAGNNDKANEKTFNFIKPFLESTISLKKDDLDADHTKTLANYTHFLKALVNILYERKSNILPKRANIFTTNYDLFIEKSYEEFSNFVILNDGFKNTTSILSNPKFNTANFFSTVYNTGNLYNYQVEIPSINLIKVHGSLNWVAKDDLIMSDLSYLEEAKELEDANKISDITEFIDLFSIILPKKDKFKQTLLNRTYYDLLRIYSNELDKENTILIADGFSFEDEHIYDITIRALKNPTLKLIIFCWDKTSESYGKKFLSNRNVEIVYSPSENFSFQSFGQFLLELLPEREEKPIYTVEIKDQDDDK